MKKYALILAGGVGSRAGGSLPKQFQTVAGLPMLWWSIKCFAQTIPDVETVVVLHPGYVMEWRRITMESIPAPEFISHHIAPGGGSRTESVSNGLRLVSALHGKKEEDAIVLIHDAARPLITAEVIERCLHTVKNGIGIIPCVKVTDSLRKKTSSGSEAVDRDNYLAVQTPQTFMLSDILKAYGSIDDDRSFTDDASVAEAVGLKIITSEGDPRNFKVTNPMDFKLAEALLK